MDRKLGSIEPTFIICCLVKLRLCEIEKCTWTGSQRLSLKVKKATPSI